MKRKKTVRKLRPQVKYGLIIIIFFIFFYWVWINFSQFIVRKDTKIKETNIQLEYRKDYKANKGDDKAKALAQLFISEFYTWRNHDRKGNISGVQYLSNDIKDHFREDVYSTYYNYFTEIKETEGNDGLPSVEKVKVLALKHEKVLPMTSRVYYNPSISPKHIVAVDVNIKYDSNTKNVTRYHKHAVVYMKKVKGDYQVVKLVSN